MNDRQRLIKLVLIAFGLFVVFFGGFVLVNKVLSGLTDQDAVLEKLEDEQNTLTRKLAMLAKAKRELDVWQTISMPTDINIASNRYNELLTHLIKKHQLSMKSSPNLDRRNVAPSATKANVTPVRFTIELEGTYAKFLAFLKEFYQLNLPHAIRDMTITAASAGAEGKLEIKLQIEALIVLGATSRNFLAAVPDRRLVVFDIVSAMKGMPLGLTMASQAILPTGLYGNRRLAGESDPRRDYDKMLTKNVFAGLVPPETVVKASAPEPDRSILKEVVLTSITSNFVATEASLRNRLTNRFIKVRNEPPLNEFEIKDENNQLVLKGKVISINPPNRTMVIQVDGKLHAMYLGQFLSQALEKELNAEEAKALAGEPPLD